MTTLLLILWFAVIAFNVWVDSDGHKPNYFQVNFMRITAMVFHLCGFTPDPSEWLLIIAVILFEVTTYFIFFPWWLNFVTQKPDPFLYIDRTEHDSGWVDRWFSKYSRGFLLFWKVLAGVVMAISIYFIYALH